MNTSYSKDQGRKRVALVPSVTKLGRPRLNPDYIPIINELVVTAPSLQSVQIKSATARSKEFRKQQRKLKQEQRAEEATRTRERCRINALYLQEQQAISKEKRMLEKAAEDVERRKRLLQQLDQARAAVSVGRSVESLNLDEPVLRMLETSLKQRRKRVQPDEHKVIEELDASGMNQVEIARQVGLSQSTVSKHLGRHFNKASGKKAKLGRPKEFTEEMEQAAARFRFLFNTKSAKDTANFLKLAYGKSFCTRTIQNHLKALGLRQSDFKTYPAKRNEPST